VKSKTRDDKLVRGNKNDAYISDEKMENRKEFSERVKKY
jgi:hypothetical protein